MLIRSLVVLSLSALVLSGCGGDDEPREGAGGTTVAPVTSTPVTDATPAEPDAKASGSGDASADASVSVKKPSGETPTWVKDVNARCKKHQDATNEKLKEFQEKGISGPEGTADAMNEVVPLGRKLISDLRTTDVPADVAPRWTSFLDTLDEAFDLIPQLTETLTSGKEDPKLMKKLQDIEKNTRPFADEFGLTGCLTSGS